MEGSLTINLLALCLGLPFKILHSLLGVLEGHLEGVVQDF